MKKNRMMRAASVLLIAVMLTTSVISGTFAKYTTSGTATDTARVAKWGVTITETTDSKLFSDAYAFHDASSPSANSVLSQTTDLVVAPGTDKAESTNFTIAGQPEVSVHVGYEGVVNLENWVVGGNYYCPLVVTVGTTTLSGLDYTDADDFESDIEAAIAAVSENYGVGTDLSAASDDLSISWSWPFEGSTGIIHATNVQDNAKDTALGNAGTDVDPSGTPATINVAVTCTVTQID
ncbi:MAG: hypothetical protein IKU72_01120 [Oscillospiraceae bacterium]|nr:hypothetical protein [Oscillospiraceae bacterium]